jgi:hypothetical protein
LGHTKTLASYFHPKSKHNPDGTKKVVPKRLLPSLRKESLQPKKQLFDGKNLTKRPKSKESVKIEEPSKLAQKYLDPALVLPEDQVELEGNVADAILSFVDAIFDQLTSAEIPQFITIPISDFYAENTFFELLSRYDQLSSNQKRLLTNMRAGDADLLHSEIQNLLNERLRGYYLTKPIKSFVRVVSRDTDRLEEERLFVRSAKSRSSIERKTPKLRRELAELEALEATLAAERNLIENSADEIFEKGIEELFSDAFFTVCGDLIASDETEAESLGSGDDEDAGWETQDVDFILVGKSVDIQASPTSKGVSDWHGKDELTEEANDEVGDIDGESCVSSLQESIVEQLVAAEFDLQAFATEYAKSMISHGTLGAKAHRTAVDIDKFANCLAYFLSESPCAAASLAVEADESKAESASDPQFPSDAVEYAAHKVDHGGLAKFQLESVDIAEYSGNFVKDIFADGVRAVSASKRVRDGNSLHEDASLRPLSSATIQSKEGVLAYDMACMIKELQLVPSLETSSQISSKTLLSPTSSSPRYIPNTTRTGTLSTSDFVSVIFEKAKAAVGAKVLDLGAYRNGPSPRADSAGLAPYVDWGFASPRKDADRDNDNFGPNEQALSPSFSGSQTPIFLRKGTEGSIDDEDVALISEMASILRGLRLQSIDGIESPRFITKVDTPLMTNPQSAVNNGIGNLGVSNGGQSEEISHEGRCTHNGASIELGSFYLPNELIIQHSFGGNESLQSDEIQLPGDFEGLHIENAGIESFKTEDSYYLINAKSVINQDGTNESDNSVVLSVKGDDSDLSVGEPEGAVVSVPGGEMLVLDRDHETGEKFDRQELYDSDNSVVLSVKGDDSDLSVGEPEGAVVSVPGGEMLVLDREHDTPKGLYDSDNSVALSINGDDSDGFSVGETYNSLLKRLVPKVATH